MNQPPLFKPQGDSALLVYLGRDIDPRINARVRALCQNLRRAPAPGVREVSPAYCSLLVQFDPLAASLADLEHWVRRRLALVPSDPHLPSREVEIPVVYGGEYGPDLEYVASHAGLTPGEVIRRHSARGYLCYMVGFTPGFPYLGGLDPSLSVPRLDSPRLNVPPGGVGVAGGQAGVYPLGGPGGWRLLGRTPLNIYDPRRNPPSLIRAGDVVRFKPAATAEFQPLPAQIGGDAPQGRKVFQVLRPGAFTTVQDAGRWGYQDQGVPVSGALDQFGLAAANLLAGAPADGAALEITLLGPKLKALSPVVVAVYGADLGFRLDGRPAPRGRALEARPGQILDFTGPRDGARAVLAVGGGLAAPRIMGSRSAYPLGRLGGPLAPGQTLWAGPRPDAPAVRRELGAPAQGGPRLEVRVIPGPNLEFFSPRGLEAFFGSDYTLSGETDRRGMRLEGPPVELAPDMPSSIVSEPNSPGVIQIPVGGAPIILLREQTVGGYAKIAAVISADLDLLARALPGTVLRFQKATREEALAVLRRRNAVLESLRPGDGP